MAVDFDQVEDLAATVAALYGEAERSLTARISRQLAAGMDAPGWATVKLEAAGALRKAARVAVAALTAGVSELLRGGIVAAYRRGWGDALAEVADLFTPDTEIGAAARAARERIPGTRAVEALAASLVHDLRDVHERIVRQPLDAYRAVIGAATARTLTGVETRREAAQAAWTGLVSRGLVRFTDRSGRDWRLTSYVEMAVRTVTARAAVQGHIDALTEIDTRLVFVSDAPQECELCRPWEGQVLALWGDVGLVYEPHELDDGATVAVEVAATLETARALGLHHPNCRHSIAAYFPGLTRVPAAQADPEGDVARQRQRYLERRIRAAKEREAAAFTDEARAAARRRVRQAQAALRDHLAKHPALKRLRYREQIGGGNLPPAGRRDDAAGAIGPVPTADRDPLDGLDLAGLADAELFRLWDEHPEAYDRVAAELERRDGERGGLADVQEDDQEPDRDPWAADTIADLDETLEAADRALRVDQLVARGWDYLEAYAEVHGQDPEELRRQERAAAVDADRREGERREDTVRRLYAEWVHLQYLAAEDATRGHMLTPEAEARGVDPVSLFSGPAHVARANASEDLLRWWAEHGRKTYTEFRAELLGRESDVRAAEQTRLRGNDRDFGV